MVKKPIGNLSSFMFCLLAERLRFSPFKRIEKNTKMRHTHNDFCEFSWKKQNDVANDALPIAAAVPMTAPEDSCFNRPGRVPRAECFFSIPPMPTQPTGAANRGGVKKLTSSFMLRNRQLQKGEWKWSPKFTVKSPGNHHHVATHDLFWCVLWLDKGWPRSKLSDAAN